MAEPAQPGSQLRWPGERDAHQPLQMGPSVEARLAVPEAQGLGTLGQGLGPNMPLSFWVPIA